MFLADSVHLGFTPSQRPGENRRRIGGKIPQDLTHLQKMSQNCLFGWHGIRHTCLFSFFFVVLSFRLPSNWFAEYSTSSSFCWHGPLLETLVPYGIVTLNSSGKVAEKSFWSFLKCMPFPRVGYSSKQTKGFVFGRLFSPLSSPLLSPPSPESSWKVTKLLYTYF